MPTLADEFQRPSGYYNSVTDYLNCARLGFAPAVAPTKCLIPYDSTQYQGLTYGNPALQPITAKVWSYGFVWSPIERMSISADYLHWDINNEVTQVDPDKLSQTEYLCDIGTLDPKSGTCAQAFSLITRGPGKGNLLGQITNISTPKLNLANEQVNAITANFNYIQPDSVTWRYRQSCTWLPGIARDRTGCSCPGCTAGTSYPAWCGQPAASC